MSAILGISAGSHDAAISIIENNNIVFASQAERFSKIKNDFKLNEELIKTSISFLKTDIDTIAFYEIPWKKRIRQLYSGQFYEAIFDNPLDDVKKNITSFINCNNIKTVSHHKAHAAQAFASPFDKAIVLVVDAIGEWDTISIWLYDSSANAYLANKSLVKLESYSYPYSLGLLYSAFTKFAGYKPNEEEYIYMALSSLGNPKYAEKLMKYIFNNHNYKMSRNFHCGLSNDDIKYIISLVIKDEHFKYNIASSVQSILESQLFLLVDRVKKYQIKYNTDNLVYSGGVALNCVANTKLQNVFKNNMWIFPSPGDSGASLGSALAIKEQKVNFNNVYLGYDINSNIYPYDEILSELLQGNIVGIATGRAEFGPRALGNRSLLADPRINNIKDKMNEIKHREKFRPFAPVIMEEYFNDYFETNGIVSSPYMQYVYKCKYAERFPAIVHSDKTSRVQTVNIKQNKKLYILLKKFYESTGCPMLLNTSLNIKGQPIVNDINDIEEFKKMHNIKIF